MFPLFLIESPELHVLFEGYVFVSEPAVDLFMSSLDANYFCVFVFLPSNDFRVIYLVIIQHLFSMNFFCLCVARCGDIIC